MKAGEKIGKGLEMIGKGILNLAGYPVEIAKGIGYGVTHLIEKYAPK